MEYAVEMGSGTMIEIGSGIQKLTGKIHSHTDGMTIT
jgi:hypothetical protein